MSFHKDPGLIMRILVVVILMPVLLAWADPCHEDCSKCQGSYAHSNCCGSHLVPGLASPAAVPQITLAAMLFHFTEPQVTPKILHSDIFRPPRA
jgi:hypothetical protein